MEWKLDVDHRLAVPILLLETFLSGMETELPDGVQIHPGHLETFLSGMETRGRFGEEGALPLLETFLSGMETRGCTPHVLRFPP